MTVPASASRFPLAQLTGAEPVAVTPPAGATVRRHILQDDHTPRDGIDARTNSFKPGRALKAHNIKPRHSGHRKLITEHNGRPSTNQLILDELAKGKALTAAELRARIPVPRNYIHRATLTLLDHCLIVRTGKRRQYVYMLSYETQASA